MKLKDVLNVLLDDDIITLCMRGDNRPKMLTAKVGEDRNEKFHAYMESNVTGISQSSDTTILLFIDQEREESKRNDKKN